MSLFGKKANNGPTPEKPGKDDTETVVGPSVKVEGDFTSQGNMRVEGQVKGSIKTSKDLMVGEGAEIEATIEVENAMVAGKVTGNITAREKLELSETARVTGDIQAKILNIAPGAIFSGNSQMTAEGTEAKESAKAKKPKKADLAVEEDLVTTDSKK